MLAHFPGRHLAASATKALWRTGQVLTLCALIFNPSLSHIRVHWALYRLSYRSVFENPPGWPMGFKPIVTGATSQRVNRFATATPVDSRGWCPITELNCYFLDVSQVSYH